MILPIRKKLVTREIGMMERFEEKDMPFLGHSVSPKFQGTNAWKLLSPEQRGQLNAALHDATTNPESKYYGLHKKDLQWRMDKFGCIHVRRTPRIVI